MASISLSGFMVYSKSPSAQSSKNVPCPAKGVRRSATFLAKALAILYCGESNGAAAVSYTHLTLPTKRIV